MASESESHPVDAQKAMSVTAGSCLCKAVQFTISGDASTTLLCHCTSCKKSTGSLFSAGAFYGSKQFQITKGQEKIKAYVDNSPDSGAVLHRSFCQDCGSVVMVTNPALPQGIIVPAGTLDLEGNGLNEWKPESEVFCQRRATWLGDAGAPPEKRFQAMT